MFNLVGQIKYARHVGIPHDGVGLAVPIPAAKDRIFRFWLDTDRNEARAVAILGVLFSIVWPPFGLSSVHRFYQPDLLPSNVRKNNARCPDFLGLRPTGQRTTADRPVGGWGPAEL